MATNFPNNPTPGDKVTVDGVTREWTGLVWKSVAPTISGPAGPTGPAGIGVPAGGTVGQILLKNSSDDYDYSWTDIIDGGTP
jgi:hypothetical protein